MTRAARLRTEYLQNPLGIDIACPRFSWIMEDTRRGAAQTAYRILVKSDAETVWDSGKVLSDQSIHIDYAGTPLVARTRYFWEVTLWNERGEESDKSESAWFETGLITESAWTPSAWIGARISTPVGELSPVPIMRRAFEVKGPVARARLYATALGLYEMHCNGKRVGDARFTPGWTGYKTRVQYQTFDVGDLLRQGANVLGSFLANGWFAGEISKGFTPSDERKQTALRAMLMIDYRDGRTDIVATDGQWKWTLSPLRYSDIYMGEHHDALKEIAGWSEASCDDAAWLAVDTMQPDCGAIVAQRGPFVKQTLLLRTRSFNQVSKGVWVYDMGQNMVGTIRLRISAPAGTVITVRCAERLNPDGTIYTLNLRRARSTAIYTCKGGAHEEIWEPQFTFFGFQYLEVTGAPGALDAETVAGIVLHTEMEPTGTFSCSDPLVNQLAGNIAWGQRGNYLDVPTDCPQRDERLGWTGDAQAFIRTASYNFDIGGFFTKWLVDLNDAQLENGCYPHVAPNVFPAGSDLYQGGCSAWADAGIICPWTMYRVYGDKRVLEEHYEGMKKWMAWQERQGTDDIKKYACFGDWCSIEAETPREIISTAFFAHTSNIMSQVASILGKTEDSAAYAALCERICKRFNEEFVSPAGRIVGETQTAYLLALHFDLVPPKKRDAAVRYLVENIRSRNVKLSCGFVGSPYINPVLSRFGRSDVAYQLLHQLQWPSWLYAVTKGATTIWERWDGWTEEKGFQNPGMNSFNHYTYGAIGEWLFSTVAGIDVDESQPGYKRIRIAPIPGGKLSRAQGRFNSIYGPIEASWEIVKESALQLCVTVPPNTSARVRIPVAGPAVTESGTPLEQAEGISAIVKEKDAVWCDVAPGSYRFLAPFRPQ